MGKKIGRFLVKLVAFSLSFCQTGAGHRVEGAFEQIGALSGREAEFQSSLWVFFGKVERQKKRRLGLFL